jgi:hypothetical protein
MAETEKPATKKPTKGGRRGGTLFPKINLQQAIDYAKKVVSKTHTGPQPEKTILPGVFGNAGPLGKVRASALKQYGLMAGTVEAYKATQLAKDIDAALDGDRFRLLHAAFLHAKLFKDIFETFQGDTVSKAKIEQRAKGLDVHPESAAECAQLFMDSAITAGLATLSGDSVSLEKAVPISPTADPVAGADAQELKELKKEDSGHEEVGAKKSAVNDASETGPEKSVNRGTKPGITLTLTVDPSSDPDKLEKQLKLLRQYGVI